MHPRGAWERDLPMCQEPTKENWGMMIPLGMIAFVLIALGLLIFLWGGSAR